MTDVTVTANGEPEKTDVESSPPAVNADHSTGPQVPNISDSTIRCAVRGLIREKCSVHVYSRIPGVQWLADSDRPIFLRVLFGFVFLLCFAMGVYSAGDRYMYYCASPIKSSTFISSGRHTRFPQVTVCLAYSLEAEYQKLDYTQSKLELLDKFSAERIWQIWNTSLSLTSIGLFTKNHETLQLRLTHVATRQGVCTVIIAESPVSIGSQLQMTFRTTSNSKNTFRNEISMVYISDVVYSASPDVMPNPNKIEMPSDSNIRVYVDMHNIYNLNRKQLHCLESASFMSCHRNCFTRKLMEAKIPCRLPYMMNNSRPYCTDFRQAFEAEFRYNELIESLQTFDNCYCPKQCKTTVYSLTEYSAPRYGSEISLSVIINSEITTHEMYAYDFVTLLWESSEIYELLTGINSLFMYIVVPVIIARTCCKMSMTAKTANVSAAMFGLISKLFDDQIQIPAKNKLSSSNSRNYFKRVQTRKYFPLWIFFVIICAVVAIFVCLLRSCAYQANPIGIQQTWNQMTRRKTPTVVLCGEGRKLSMFKAKIAKKRKISSCSKISLFDILDEPKMTFGKLWNLTSIQNELVRGFYPGQSIKEISTPYGLCLQLTGGYSEVVAIFRLQAFGCGPGLKMFVSPDEEPSDNIWLTPKSDILPSVMTNFKFEETEINEYGHQCSDNNNNTCGIVRWKNTLKKLKCRLPYMPEDLGIKECASADELKASHELYFKLLANFNPFAPPCLRPCKQKLLTFQESTKYMGSFTSIRFSYATSLMQNLYTYSKDYASKYLHDCLRIIKTILGVSLMGLICGPIAMLWCVINCVIGQIGKKHSVSNFSAPVVT